MVIAVQKKPMASKLTPAGSLRYNFFLDWSPETIPVLRVDQPVIPRPGDAGRDPGELRGTVGDSVVRYPIQ